MKLKQFAEKANKTIEDVIADLERAGIHGMTADSDFTREEMKALVNFRISGRIQQVEQGTFRVASTTGRQTSEYEITVSTRGGRRLAPLQVETPPVPVASVEHDDEHVEEADEQHDGAEESAASETVADQQKDASQVDETDGSGEEDSGQQVDETESDLKGTSEAAQDSETQSPTEAQVNGKDAADSKDADGARAGKGAKQRRKNLREKEPRREKLRIVNGKSRLLKDRQKKSKPRISDQEHNRHGFHLPQTPRKVEVQLDESNTISDLARAMSVKAGQLTKKLYDITGELNSISIPIDKETAQLLVEEMGHMPVESSSTNLEATIVNAEEDTRKTVPRHPVVAVMGHVDHGKTTLLDCIRSTKVAAGEKGGITQHIGAYVVPTNKGKITFFDTPGHEAFTKMRVRGAKATDIVVLVVAADDGVKPQTIEAINHAKDAGVPIIVAINKIDKAKSDSRRVLRELTEHDIVPEPLGGDVQIAEISALKGQGIDALLELIELESELLDLKAPNNGAASGVVIEVRVDRGRGKVVTVLVQKGKLNVKDVIVAGTQWGRVRALADDRSKRVKSALPGTPIEIEGFKDVPVVGDDFVCVADERVAQQLVDIRGRKLKPNGRPSTDKSFGDDEQKSLKIIIKADVQGSVEALSAALKNLSTDEIKVNVIQGMVGGVSQSDVDLAVASDALIIAFNAKAEATARNAISEHNVKVIYSSIIYHALDETAQSIEDMSAPKITEEVIGRAKVREVFNLTRIGTVAGSYVEDGAVRNNAQVRVFRNDTMIHEGMIHSLKRFERDVAEVKAGNECGIQIKNFSDVNHEDLLEVFRTTVAQ